MQSRPEPPDIGQGVHDVHGSHRSRSDPSRGMIRGIAERLGAKSRGVRKRHPLCQQRSDDAREHVTTAPSGEARVAGSHRQERTLGTGNHGRHALEQQTA